MSRQLNGMLQKGSPKTFGNLGAEKLRSLEKLIKASASARYYLSTTTQAIFDWQRCRGSSNRFCAISNECRKYSLLNWISLSNASCSRTQLRDHGEGTSGSSLGPSDTAPFSAVGTLHGFTDHIKIHWLLNMSEPSRRLIRWRLRLSEFDFVIQYKEKAGKFKYMHFQDCLWTQK